MPSKNWDRVHQEEKYERGIRAHERFLESLVTENADRVVPRPRTRVVIPRRPEGSSSVRSQQRPDANSIRRELVPVQSHTWKEFEGALKSELVRMAHDRVLVVAASRAQQLATSGHAQGLYVAFPVTRTRMEAASARARGFDVGTSARLAGKW